MKMQFTVCRYADHDTQDIIAHLLNTRYNVPAISTSTALLVNEREFDKLDWSMMDHAMHSFREWLNGQAIAKVVERDFGNAERYILRICYPNVNGIMDILKSHSVSYLEWQANYINRANGEYLAILDTYTGKVLEIID